MSGPGGRPAGSDPAGAGEVGEGVADRAPFGAQRERCSIARGASPEGYPITPTASRLTPNGGGPAGERPESARERNAAGSPRASRPALRRFFAPGTPASADAISQLENLDRALLTRRDIERLFGVSKARAATLMQTFGAELVGNQRTLPRTKLPQQLKKHRSRAAFRGEEERRARLVTELRKARITGIRVPLPAETLNSKLASLPEGVTVERDRIEVRFAGAKNATERLYALAFALVNDYERFEALVDRGVGGGGEVVKR